MASTREEKERQERQEMARIQELLEMEARSRSGLKPPTVATFEKMQALMGVSHPGFCNLKSREQQQVMPAFWTEIDNVDFREVPWGNGNSVEEEVNKILMEHKIQNPNPSNIIKKCFVGTPVLPADSGQGFTNLPTTEVFPEVSSCPQGYVGRQGMIFLCHRTGKLENRKDHVILANRQSVSCTNRQGDWSERNSSIKVTGISDEALRKMEGQHPGTKERLAESNLNFLVIRYKQRTVPQPPRASYAYGGYPTKSGGSGLTKSGGSDLKSRSSTSQDALAMHAVYSGGSHAANTLQTAEFPGPHEFFQVEFYQVGATVVCTPDAPLTHDEAHREVLKVQEKHNHSVQGFESYKVITTNRLMEEFKKQAHLDQVGLASEDGLDSDIFEISVMHNAANKPQRSVYYTAPDGLSLDVCIQPDPFSRFDPHKFELEVNSGYRKPICKYIPGDTDSGLKDSYLFRFPLRALFEALPIIVAYAKETLQNERLLRALRVQETTKDIVQQDTSVNLSNITKFYGSIATEMGFNIQQAKALFHGMLVDMSICPNVGYPGTVALIHCIHGYIEMRLNVRLLIEQDVTPEQLQFLLDLFDENNKFHFEERRLFQDGSRFVTFDISALEDKHVIHKCVQRLYEFSRRNPTLRDQFFNLTTQPYVPQCVAKFQELVHEFEKIKEQILLVDFSATILVQSVITRLNEVIELLKKPEHTQSDRDILADKIRRALAAIETSLPAQSEQDPTVRQRYCLFRKQKTSLETALKHVHMDLTVEGFPFDNPLTM